MPEAYIVKDIERFHDRIAYLEMANDRFQREIERLRVLLKRIVDCPQRPWPFRGGELDIGQHQAWFALMCEATEAAGGKDVE